MEATLMVMVSTMDMVLIRGMATVISVIAITTIDLII
jgi:hypothetical protein